MGLPRNKIRNASKPPTRPPPTRPNVAQRKREAEDEYTGPIREQGSKSREEGVAKKPRITPMQSNSTNAASPCSKLYVDSAKPARCIVSENRKLAHGKRDDLDEQDGYYGKMKSDFEAQKEARGMGQSKEERAELFKHLVRTKVFNKVKFILRDADLDMCGTVYNSILKHMKSIEQAGVDIDQYWAVHRKLVRQTLNTKRGAVNGMMKAAFMSKF